MAFFLMASAISANMNAIRARGQGELLLKEALHIQMTPAEECFNWDKRLEIPGSWITLVRGQEGRSNRH